MAGTGEKSAQVIHHDKPVKQIHHGRTVAAWVGTTVAMLAFLIGGIALILQNWPMFWAAAALLAVSVIAAGVLQKMGYGAH